MNVITESLLEDRIATFRHLHNRVKLSFLGKWATCTFPYSFHLAQVKLLGIIHKAKEKASQPLKSWEKAAG